jgi:hypothetical protein
LEVLKEERPIRGREDNITMDLQEVLVKGIEWILLRLNGEVCNKVGVLTILRMSLLDE